MWHSVLAVLSLLLPHIHTLRGLDDYLPIWLLFSLCFLAVFDKRRFLVEDLSFQFFNSNLGPRVERLEACCFCLLITISTWANETDVRNPQSHFVLSLVA